MLPGRVLCCSLLLVALAACGEDGKAASESDDTVIEEAEVTVESAPPYVGCDKVRPRDGALRGIEYEHAPDQGSFVVDLHDVSATVPLKLSMGVLVNVSEDVKITVEQGADSTLSGSVNVLPIGSMSTPEAATALPTGSLTRTGDVLRVKVDRETTAMFNEADVMQMTASLTTPDDETVCFGPAYMPIS